MKDNTHKKLLRQYYAVARLLNLKPDATEAIKERYGVKHMSELSSQQLIEIINTLDGEANR